MKVLSIGTDRNIFKEHSPAWQRAIEYGSLFDELHIVIFARKNLKLKKEQIASNVWIYPTNSLSRFLYIRDALRISKKVIIEKGLTPINSVVTAQDPAETGRVALKIKQVFGFRMQIQVHTDIFSSFYARASFLNRIRVRIARSVLPIADSIRVVSERIKESIIYELMIPARKIDVLPIFVDQTTFLQSPKINLKNLYPQFDHIILMASRLEREKNILYALTIFTTILKSHPKAGLIIIGDGSQVPLIKYQITLLGIQKSVVLLPWQQELASYYKTADIFLSTSLYEGYGLTLVEAALSECAIVTSDVGIARHILIDEKNACVCPVNDSACFIQKISSLLDNSNLRQTFAKQAYKDIQHVIVARNQEYLDKYKILIESLLQ